jgi:multidrug resistance efflux pump
MQGTGLFCRCSLASSALSFRCLTIHAPRKGVVKAFRFAPGDQVSDGADLVELDEAA